MRPKRAERGVLANRPNTLSIHSRKEGQVLAGSVFYLFALLLGLSLMAFEVDAASSGEPIEPLPQNIQLDSGKIALGERLFHDPRLSGNNTIACASCHPIAKGGMDNMPHSVGINGQLGIINTPTVFNSGFAFSQFWDGRAVTLEEQIEGPFNNPIEMDGDWSEVILKLRSDSAYRQEFTRLYSGGISRTNIKEAIATYERSLITPNAPFDRYLRGEKNAISAGQKRGYQLFKSYGCSSCHQGRLVGGNLYEKMGIVHEYFTEERAGGDADLGRFSVTGDEHHRHHFKVPSLRNIARTAPYFHDASATKLKQAVTDMGYYQLGLTLPDESVADIVSFLRSLTGELPGVSR
ncbi:MAG: cytochrome-c peroxidase [Sedimenticola sp.]